MKVKFKIQKVWGDTPNGYTHLPILWLGWGNKKIGLTLFCVMFSLSWKDND